MVGSTRMKDSGRKRLRCGYEDARRFHIPCFSITSHLGDPYGWLERHTNAMYPDKSVRVWRKTEVC